VAKTQYPGKKHILTPIQDPTSWPPFKLMAEERKLMAKGERK